MPTAADFVDVSTLTAEERHQAESAAETAHRLVAAASDDTPSECPSCGALDWVRDGHAARRRGEPVQVFRCRSCGKKRVGHSDSPFRHPLFPPEVMVGAVLLRQAGWTLQRLAEVVAVEVNLSCPNLESRGAMFAHDPELSAEVIAAALVCGRPVWAKLSPNTHQVVEVARAVEQAGAEAVTLINTLLGMVIDRQTMKPALGNGGGGVSGRAIHPIAVRVVHDVRRELPTLPIVGVGGVASGWDAAELMIAGAQAVQVGTANFADPRACARVIEELIEFAAKRKIPHLGALTAVV